jgi:transcriptional regulator with XRE-family HTH domain
MGRARSGEPTALGAAMRARRGATTLEQLAAELGTTHATLSRLERGEHRPTADTARRLARWLAWSVEQVLDAADAPAPAPEGAR